MAPACDHAGHSLRRLRGRVVEDQLLHGRNEIMPAVSASPLQLVLVRHGETEWSRDKRHTGRTDIALTDNGVAEAQAVKPLLERFEFRRVLSSPLSRALETCKLAGLGDRAELRAELLEWNYGEYE